MARRDAGFLTFNAQRPSKFRRKLQLFFALLPEFDYFVGDANYAHFRQRSR